MSNPSVKSKRFTGGYYTKNIVGCQAHFFAKTELFSTFRMWKSGGKTRLFFYHQPLVFRAAKDNKMCRYAPAGMWKTVWKTFFASLEHDYCHAVLALAVNAESEALDIRRLAQILVDSAPERAGALAVDNGELAETHTEHIVNISVELHDAVVNGQPADVEPRGGIHVHLALNSRAACAGVRAALLRRVLDKAQVFELYTRLCRAREDFDISVSVNGRKDSRLLAEIGYKNCVAL